MTIILTLLVFYSISFAIKETGLLNRPRIWIIGLHPFFYELLSCWYCTGFWAGLLTYLLFFEVFHWREFLIYGLAGAVWSLIMNSLMDKLNK